MDQQPLAQCPAGTFMGIISGESWSWKGIRYAEAPVGANRWRAPVPKRPLEGILECFTYAPACPQLPNVMVTLPTDVLTDDDCLAINIWAPKATDEPVPVMVWVHGGAFMFGAAHQPEYDGSHLAAEGKVVVVSLNYRLGPLGFLDLTQCGEPGDFDANLALRDVLLALEWVQENIAGFGGDPGRVTLFGESAGGAMVTTLLASPAAEGLFHRAIAQSAPASSVYGRERAFQISKRVLARLGISARDAVELREVPVDEILRVATDIYEEIPSEVPGTLAFVPVIDGDIVPESPIEALHQGRGLKVPLMIGTNRDEASVFRFMRTPILPITEDRIERMLAEVQLEHPDIEVPPIKRLHKTTEGLRLQSLGVGIARDIGFRLPAVWIAEGHAGTAPTWLYRFDHATPLLTATGLGAAHASEIAYIWRTLDAPSSELVFWFGGKKTAHEVSRRMSARWVSFAYGNDPNTGDPDDPAWPVYAADHRLSLVIDKQDSVELDLDAKLRESWGEGILAFS